jgi:threonine aldolase
MIDFRSDNTGRAAPEILDAMLRANAGTALGYGGDEWTARLQDRFSELFETRVRVFPVATGTAANGLSLAALSPPWGNVYCSEAAHINTSVTEAARAYGLRVHMDGARFANAVARLGCRPAEMSWRAGVDIMSFGATKNGGALCDAVVVFNPELAEKLAWNLRRSGQVWSKMRFASAQLMAYVEDGLWLRLAQASNAATSRIAAGIETLPGLRLVAPVEANEIFLELPDRVMDELEQDGFQFYRRTKVASARFVCRFDLTDAEADALVAALRRHCGAAARAAE